MTRDRPPTDMKSLGNALYHAEEGTGEIKSILCSATFCPRLPGLTKMISKLSKEGAYRKGLEVFYALPDLGIACDTTITNAAISACDKGNQWQTALEIFWSMPDVNLQADAITYSSVISALAKGKQWAAALQVFGDMQSQGVEADVVTCCSLISALERGGQWQLAEQLFKQMCSASQHSGNRGLENLAAMLDRQPPLVDSSSVADAAAWGAQVLVNPGTSNDTSARTSEESGAGSSTNASSTPCGDKSNVWNWGRLLGVDLPPNVLPGNPKDSPTSLADTTARLSLDTARESSSCDSTLSRSMSWVGRGRPSQGTAKMPTDRAEESRSPQEQLSQSSAATEGPATPEKKAVQPSASLSPPENGLKPKASESEVPPKEGFKLWPFKTLKETKAESPQKRFPQLSNIQESSQYSEANAPVPPGTPGGSSLVTSTSILAAEARRAFGLGSLRGSALANQFSVGSITVGVRDEAAARAARNGALATTAAAKVNFIDPSQLSLGSFILPITMERQSDENGRSNPELPMVPKLKHMNVSRIAPNRVCCNALLAAFARARPTQWKKALTLLEAMKLAGKEISPDVVSYNTTLKACGGAGQLDQAIEVYKGMLRHGVVPSITTYGTLLTAASHAGSYETVKQVWAWLVDSGVDISSDCVHAYVSALAKRGKVGEARDILRHALNRRSNGRQDPTLRQVANMPPGANGPSAKLPLYPETQTNQAALPNGLEPEKRLNQLSQLALTATQQELPPLAAEAFSVFQQYAATGSPPGHIFASLLCILGCAGLWDTAFRVYNLVPVKEVLDVGVVSNLVAGYSASGQFFWALHYWLAQRQQELATPSLNAHQALLCACRDRAAWQPALHVLYAMLASTVMPDRICYGTVMQALVKAGLLREAAQILLHMPQKGVWPDPLLMADVLSNLDVSTLPEAVPALNTLLQAMSACGLGNSKTLAEVAKGVCPANLPALALHLLSCLPLGSESAAETHWVFIGVLILSRQIAAAVQVSYHGHSIRALTHYKPLSAAAGGGDGKDPLAAVNLSTCGAESAAIVLLGWACSVCQALQQGFKFRVEEVVISVGPEAEDYAKHQQRASVIAVVRTIFAAAPDMTECGLLSYFPFPVGTPLHDKLASIPADGVIKLPTADLTAWTSSIDSLARSLLLPP